MTVTMVNLKKVDCPLKMSTLLILGYISVLRTKYVAKKRNKNKVTIDINFLLTP